MVFSATQNQTAVDLLEYVAVSAGMMFGASCYLVLGVIAGANSVRYTGLAIAIAATLCIAVALAVGEMASRFPSAPGIRTYLKRAFGDEFSLFFTYLSLLVVILFAGIEIKVFCDAWWPGTAPHARALATFAMICFLGYLNITGRELPHLLQVLICFALVAGTIALSWVAMTRFDTALAYAPSAPQASFMSSIGISFFIFIGFEWVTPTAKSPEASRWFIPISMVIAIVTLAITYLLFALALKVALPSSDLLRSTVPQVLLGGRLFPHYGFLLTRCLSFLALLTILNAGVIGASRLLYILARDRSFFGWLNKRLSVLNSKGVPSASVLLLCGLCLLSSILEIYFDAAQNVAQVCAGLYCLVYCAFVASHIRLRKRPIDKDLFRSLLPTSLYYVLAAILLMLGIATFLGSADHISTRLPLLTLITFLSGAAAVSVAKSRRIAQFRKTS
ncbi:MAG TPA: APC family permease [Burkholderiales bacterium]|nr:APC family permease [Burkholderiales bacterium]